MYQILLIGLLLFASYYMIQNTLGWNGNVTELPAYHISLIRSNLRKRNAVVIRNFLTEEAKQEYDILYDELQTMDPASESDIILDQTSLTQIEECMNAVPIMFQWDWFWPPHVQYLRILNKEERPSKSKKQLHFFCAIQPLSVTIQNGAKQSTLSLQTGDALICPRMSQYYLSKGTIDCFNYFK